MIDPDTPSVSSFFHVAAYRCPDVVFAAVSQNKRRTPKAMVVSNDTPAFRFCDGVSARGNLRACGDDDDDGSMKSSIRQQIQHRPQLLHSKVWPSSSTQSSDSTSITQRVSFNHFVETAYIQPLHQLSEEDKFAMFLTQGDYARIRKEMKDGFRARIQHLQQQKQIQSNNHCSITIDDEQDDFTMRGLETKTAQEERRSSQRRAREAVLNEQFLQYSQCQSIPEVIALLYNVFAFPSQQRAYYRAIQDSLAAHSKDHHDTNNKNTRLLKSNDLQVQEISDDSMVWCDGVVTQLVKQYNPKMHVEDWLLGRFHFGQQLAVVDPTNETRHHHVLLDRSLSKSIDESVRRNKRQRCLTGESIINHNFFI